MRRPKKPTTAKGGQKRGVSKSTSHFCPRTVAQYKAMPPKIRDTYDRVVRVVARIQSDKTSLQRAAQEYGISPRTIKRWAGSALVKRSNGRWTAKKHDRLLRAMQVPTVSGASEIVVRGRHIAGQLGRYWSALQRYLQTGDASRLEKFQGKSIRAADGTQIHLLTDRRELNRLGSAGVLSFESLYSRSA